MFLEIAFLQKFLRFLSHPLYAISVVLCGFLVFAGLGSSVSRQLRRITNRWPKIPSISVAIIGITLVSALYLLYLPIIFSYFADLADSLKIIISLVLIAPLAFFMGMPFPSGIDALHRTQQQLIPWAWGVNGFASVISAILAILLAIEIGFSGLVVSAVLLYLLSVPAVADIARE